MVKRPFVLLVKNPIIGSCKSPSPRIVKHVKHVYHVAVCQNLVPLMIIKIAGKWMFIPLKMVCTGIDP